MLVVEEEELTHQEQILGLVDQVLVVLVVTVVIQDHLQFLALVVVVEVDLIVQLVVLVDLVLL